MTEISEVFEIDDPSVFETLNNPLRLRILRRLNDPRSVKEIAESLDLPVTRLYYHFNLLEDIGAVRVVETRKVGAMTERRYQVTAKNFRPSADLMSSGEDPEKLAQVATSLVLDGARLDSEAALTRHFAEKAQGNDGLTDEDGSLGRTLAYLTPEQAKDFSLKLRLLLDEIDQPEDPEDGIEYGFSYVFFPIVGADRGGPA